jgi:hypothetical protein
MILQKLGLVQTPGTHCFGGLHINICSENYQYVNVEPPRKTCSRDQYQIFIVNIRKFIGFDQSAWSVVLKLGLVVVQSGLKFAF